MAKLTSALFFLATLVGCVFTFPLLQQNVTQLEDDLLLVSGDISIMYSRITEPPRTAIPQSEFFPSQLALTNNDLQRCINDLHKMQSIESADAAMVLKIIEDFQPKLGRVLEGLQGEKTYYQRLHTVSTILRQVKALQSAMGSLMGKLAKALPSQFQGEADTLQANMGAEFYETVRIYSTD